MQDKASLKSAHVWLDRAREDISWARYNLKGKYFTQVCFITQQVVEKALKAFLRFQGVRVEAKYKTHDLVFLNKECQKFDSQFKNLKHKTQILNQYYAPTRYPEILTMAEYTNAIAQEAVSIAEDTVEFISKKLK